MNILLLTDSLGIGGAETHIKTLAAELFKVGQNVTVAAPEQTLKGELPCGVEFAPLPPLSKNPYHLVRTYLALCRILRRGKYDIVHSHARLPALLCASLRRRGAVLTIHAKYPKSRVGRLIFRRNTPVICVSEDLRGHIIKSFGVKEENITVISNGIDTSLFYPDRKKARGHSVVFVSRLDKNCSLSAVLLCRIAGKMRRRYGDFTLKIVGGGDRYSKIEAFAEAINAAVGADVITMTGNVGDVSPILREADIFVGVSRAALEAAACGVPVILSGDEGYGGILDEQKMSRPDAKNLCARDGILPKSEYLFNDICRLFDMSGKEREALEQAEREYIRKFYSAESMARKTLDLYRAVEKCGKEKGLSVRRRQRRGRERKSSHPAC